MNILHYSLGFPPYRSGGLTKFCMDLAKQQVTDGHKVSMLWAGSFTLFGRKTAIKQGKTHDGIASYEVINPNPVPYDEGILDIKAFLAEGCLSVYTSFLKTLKPDVLHIHTLMGLHKSLLDAAKEQNIRIVFSAHDFFPICAKVTLFKDGAVCDDAENCLSCGRCNLTALSLKKIKILQSGVYRELKESPLVRILRKRHRSKYLGEDNGQAKVDNEGTAEDDRAKEYRALRKHYEQLVNYADIIHFNSSLTGAVYEKYLDPGKCELKVLPITHAGIRDNRIRRRYSDKLRITYLGAQSRAKGYHMLKAALDEIKDKKDISLNVFFQPSKPEDYINVHNSFSYDDLAEIFDNTDILAAPSLLYDTFGYTVLEALSFGVPVLISDNVGAKDIVPAGCGIVLKDTDKQKIAYELLKLDARALDKMNENIINTFKVYTIEELSADIEKEFYGTKR